MKRIYLSLLSALAITTNANALEITVSPHFPKAGAFYYLTLTSQKKSIQDGKTTSEGSAETPVQLKIVPAPNNLVQANWQYGTTTVTTQGQNVQAPGVNLTFEMIFNNKGEYQGLKNFQQLKADYTKSMEQISKNSTKVSESSMKEVVQRITKDEETFANFVMREPMAYFFPWGMTFDTNKPIEYQTEFDYLGLMKLPVTGKVTVKPIDKNGMLIISGTQKTDLKKNDRDGTPHSISMRETSSYTVEISTGFVQKFTMNRVVKGQSPKGNRVDEQRIEITLNK